MPGRRHENVHEFVRVGGHPNQRIVARFRCAKCRTETIDFSATGPQSAEKLAKAAREAGWECDHRHHSSVICPTCQAARRGKVRGESPGKKTTHFPIPFPPYDPAPSARKPGWPDADMPPVTIDQGQKTMTTDPTRKPTVEENRSIREALTNFFNEDAGIYTDQYSDDRVAREINVPRVWVSTMRESFFGPLKEPPEIATLNERMQRLFEALAKREADQVALAARCSAISTDIAALKTSINAVNGDLLATKKKFGVP